MHFNKAQAAHIAAHVGAIALKYTPRRTLLPTRKIGESGQCSCGGMRYVRALQIKTSIKNDTCHGKKRAQLQQQRQMELGGTRTRKSSTQLFKSAKLFALVMSNTRIAACRLDKISHEKYTWQ